MQAETRESVGNWNLSDYITNIEKIGLQSGLVLKLSWKRRISLGVLYLLSTSKLCLLLITRIT
jgi:hypothetical protein